MKYQRNVIISKMMSRFNLFHPQFHIIKWSALDVKTKMVLYVVQIKLVMDKRKYFINFLPPLPPTSHEYIQNEQFESPALFAHPPMKGTSKC